MTLTVDAARFLPHATEAARTSHVHGPAHWRAVSQNGEELAAKTPGADGHVVTLFAGLHDARRHSDGHDPEHGARAAELVRKLHVLGALEATEEQLALLTTACEGHAHGHTTSNPTIACCWDADRLDLPRCGINPDPKLLSTALAQSKAHALLASLAEAEEDEVVFVRFGHPPRDGHSYNKVRMRHLRGLSVYEGREVQGGIVIKIPETTAPPKRFRLCEKLIACMLEGRPVFVAEGVPVATGPDGEPLLQEATLTPIADDVLLHPPEWMSEVPGAETLFAEWRRWYEEYGPAPVPRSIRDAPRDLRDRGRRVLAACRLFLYEQPLESCLIDREVLRGSRPRVGRANPWYW